jgi:drug/metabolite transporter (DMT)-like permease
MEKLGAFAAFGTAVCWSLSAIFFETATKRVGALAVNFWKVTLAFVFLTATALLTRLMPLPLDAPLQAWIYLPLSGFIGFVIADYFLLNAYDLIGSRVTVIFQSLTPLFTAMLALLLLGEQMRMIRLLGMAVVVCGILIVVLSRVSSRKQEGSKRLSRKGLLYAFLSSFFQAAGLVVSKIGLGSYNVISGTQIRVFTAMVGFAIQALILRQSFQVFARPTKDRVTVKATTLGAIFGPFIGVVFSLFALQNTQAGTASTLMALTPVLIIPPSLLLLKQKVTVMEMIGAAIAVSGAALFFLL